MEEIENYIPEEEAIPKKVKFLSISQKRFAYLGALILLLILLVISLYSYIYFQKINKGREVVITPTPTLAMPTPTPTHTPSRWATDSAVLKSEQEVNNIERELNNLDLSEPLLNFPSLDFNINFEKQR